MQHIDTIPAGPSEPPTSNSWPKKNWPFNRFIYRIEWGGAVYWASALSIAEAVGLCLMSYSGENPTFTTSWCPDHSFEDGLSSIAVKTVPSKEALGVSITDEETGSTNVWAAHLESRSSSILGCSEWP